MRGTIRVINLNLGQVTRHFLGHGSSINELKFHHVHRELLTSASKDRSLISWNVLTEVQVYNHAGIYGHQDEVLSCDYSSDGNLLATSGMDHAVIIWDISSRHAQLALKASRVFDMKMSNRPFPTMRLTPIFITKEVHSNYIDCVRWYEGFIVSKSCEDEIKIWEPDLSQPNELSPSPPILCMMSYPVPQSPNWYVRFGLDRQKRFMAVGNQVGKIILWDLDTLSNEPKITTHHPKVFSQCRQVAFSPNSSTLVAVFDDTTVWRYTLQAPEQAVQKVQTGETD
ncbi:unnamed protein product [Oikopleura dioica]|uniref:Uncharacterized protein n=1 Tax=Oikopleura dioica TaxID=34765 RepID=E4XGN4_OIKDI|nr:unnamed protein product [Oikopleura dioica]